MLEELKKGDRICLLKKSLSYVKLEEIGTKLDGVLRGFGANISKSDACTTSGKGKHHF